MAHFLAYWETFFRDYGPDSAQHHVLTKGYGSGKLSRVKEGDTIWVVVRQQNDEWRLAQRIVVRELYDDKSSSSAVQRAVGDVAISAFFKIEDQPNFETILVRLKFESGKQIAAKGASIGNYIQSVRPLSSDDAELLVNYSRSMLGDEPFSQLMASEDEDPEVRRRRVVQVNQIIRNQNLVRWIKELYGDACQVCGETIQLPGGKFYSEVHHIQPLGADEPGPDAIENMICVCPNCHVRLDFGVVELDATCLTIHREHNISDSYIRYHNTSKFQRVESR